MYHLVIVESPTKAKTISKFLPSEFKVASSYGHIRDLPGHKMGVDVEKDFTPTYVIPRRQTKKVTELKKLAKKSDLIFFATDEDREGEAIAWHLSNILKPSEEKTKRITFHEITKEAIEEALKNPRGININLVDAQQARRILDRLVGYELSPFLWRKVAPKLSAGRVQSVALRLVVEREREIQNFKKQEYWTIEALLKKLQGDESTLKATLHSIDGKPLEKFAIKSEAEAKNILKNLDGAKYIISDIQKKETKKTPPAPFTTSTLQQEANRKLNFSAQQTMLVAQQLYEGVDTQEGSTGLITYMRTDSVNLSQKFIESAREFIAKNIGKNYAAPSPKIYKTKSKLAQEAHEAIRPTDPFRTPESIKEFLDPRQFKLYQLIWQRAIACQMSDALIDSTTISIDANRHTFKATGSVIKFDGYLKVYPSKMEDVVLPAVEKNEELKLLELKPEQHFTEPPPRYSDASLVKALEEYGIGRPSTYAPTIATLIERGYVERIERRRLQPKEIGFLVNDVLVQHFPEIVDYQFTANMEDDLDKIASGDKKWVPLIKEFYAPFKERLNEKYKEVSKKDLIQETTNEICDKCGKPMVIRMSRYGKFLACSGFPECRNTKKLNNNGENNNQGPSTGVKCPECKEGEIIARRSKRGRIFYSCNRYPDCKFALWNKPTGDVCEKCGSLKVFGRGDQVVCSNKECR